MTTKKTTKKAKLKPEIKELLEILQEVTELVKRGIAHHRITRILKDNIQKNDLIVKIEEALDEE